MGLLQTIIARMPPRPTRWTDGWETPITPGPVDSPPYTYSRNDPCYNEDVFKMDSVAQTTKRDLSLFYSNASKETNEPAKKWFTTQLHIYGIPFKKSATRPELKKVLETAFKTEKVC